MRLKSRKKLREERAISLPTSRRAAAAITLSSPSPIAPGACAHVRDVLDGEVRTEETQVRRGGGEEVRTEVPICAYR